MRILERNEGLELLLNNLHLSVLESGYLCQDAGWNFYRICSPFHRLYYILGGDAFVSCEKEKIFLEPEKIYFIPAGAVCDYGCRTRIEKVYFHLNMELYPGKDIFPSAPFCSALPDTDRAGLRLKRLLESRGLCSGVQVQSALYETVCRFLELIYQGEQARFDLLLKYQRLFSFFRTNLSAGLRIPDFAEQMGMPAETLSSEFKKDFGVSLKSYTSALLIKRIKQYLLTTNMTIEEIAGQLHYCDSFYLSRFFKKQVGMAPRVYRSLMLTDSGGEAERNGL